MSHAEEGWAPSPAPGGGVVNILSLLFVTLRQQSHPSVANLVEISRHGAVAPPAVERHLRGCGGQERAQLP